eukprot:NODE_15193_length_1063_cov_5.214744.p1 GENE.NODE_15193_length_1063_cov_5.214744~~NODE_15193_length_1063_cov_5.214744.p1  ORF type:complete len:136 (+),score=9.13 NODE_15193_length_1063_cov_5.214744:446-853(+)
MAERIDEILTADGVVVFLLPSSYYRSDQVNDWPWKEEPAGWYSVWREQRRRFSRCDFSYGKVEQTAVGEQYVGTPWKPMTVWDPLFLAKRFYGSFLDMSFVDTKGIYLRDFADDTLDDLVEPWFDVLVGVRKKSR